MANMAAASIKHFSRIIAPIDGSKTSERAFEKAVQLGKKLNVAVTELYVIDMAVFLHILTPDQISTNLETMLRKEVQDS